MRDPKRIPEILKAIEKEWKKYPDLRLGQLLVNVISEYNMFYVEDEDLVEKLKLYEMK